MASGEAGAVGAKGAAAPLPASSAPQSNGTATTAAGAQGTQLVGSQPQPPGAQPGSAPLAPLGGAVPPAGGGLAAPGVPSTPARVTAGSANAGAKPSAGTPGSAQKADLADGDADDDDGDAEGVGEGKKGCNIKRAWSAEEDATLLKMIEVHGAQSWSTIASFLVGRVGKQCRERWFNHLCPEVVKGDWTPEEDKVIMDSVRDLGTCWSKIVKFLPGRTDNAIKNRYNSTMRKNQRAQLKPKQVPALLSDVPLDSGVAAPTKSPARKKKRPVGDGDDDSNGGGGGSSSGGGGFKEISDLPDDETTSAFGKVIKFGFVLSLLACVVVYLPAMNLGQTSSAIILAGSREPLFQVSGARRLRGYANQKLMCEEVLKNGAMELLLEQLGSDDRVVREEATTTIEAMCRGACAEGARGRYERAVAAQQ
mmetsp:Transcript_31659/g.79088  ORF Transcript_31659/g.79088 Transcript_31659/m.79088 type:complete len:423 (+) Transcript_31659:560-1828(+)